MERGAADTWQGEPAERAFARFVLSLWPVGDRYRLLLSLARRDLGAERVTEVLLPAREVATAILARGQHDGAFHTHLPAHALSAGLEAMTVALREAVNTGALEDDGTRAAVAQLIVAGVPEATARAVVDEVAPTVIADRAPDA